MTKAERICRVLANADKPLDATEILSRDPQLGNLQTVRVSLCNYVRYEWLVKHGSSKPIKYSLHPEWRRRVPFHVAGDLAAAES